MLFKYAQYLIGFLIGSNIYISIVSASFAFTSFLIFGCENIYTTTLFVFFATKTAYNMQRYFKWRNKIAHKFISPYIPSSNLGWLLLIGISIVPTCVFIFYLSQSQLILLLSVSAITSLYLFVHPLTKKLTGLRYVPFLKTFIVAFCWTGLFFILSFEKNHYELFSATWKFWLILFLEIWQACILFDLRDVEVDKNDVKTIANVFPKNLLLVFWTLISLLILDLSLTEINYQLVLPLYSAIAIIQIFCILKNVKPLLFTFLLDGSLIVFAILNYLVFTIE